MIERPIGRGTLVLCADSFFFSNEALRMQRHPGLLAWLMGNHVQAIFDESHLGIQKQPGIAGLARRYRLHGLLVSLLLLAGLFVWKNAVSFVPPADGEYLTETDGETNGLKSPGDATAGLISLLRRNVQRRDILRLCWDEWMKSGGPEKRMPADRLKRAEAIIQEERSRPANHKNPVGVYQRICRILQRTGLSTGSRS